eukprot:gene7100-7903_t
MPSKNYYILMCILVSAFGFNQATLPSNGCEKQSSLQMSAHCILWRLLKGYDKRIRPKFQGPPIDVALEMLISNVFDVSEVNNQFAVEIYLRQFWNDERLQLSKFNYTRPLFLNSESIKELWIPSTYFVKSKSAFRHHITTDNVLLRVSPNGDVFYSQRLSVTASCIMDLRYFPHDYQQCKLNMESYAYQDTDLTYSWAKEMPRYAENIRSQVFDVPSFELTDIKLNMGKNHYSIGKHAYLLATFYFQRKVGFFVIETYIPSCIVVSYVKVIDWFLLVCLLFVFAALLEYAFVLHFNSKSKKKESTKKECKKLKGKKIIYNNTFMKQQNADKSSDDGECKKSSFSLHDSFQSWPIHTEDSEEVKCNGRKNILSDLLVLPGRIDSISRKSFPAGFAAFLCIYWLMITLGAR